MDEIERFDLIAEIAKLPEADKQFVLGYAAGVLAKATESPKPTKRRGKKGEKKSA